VPDPNKHAVLNKQGFKIAKTCSTCEWWKPRMGHGNGNWGRCEVATYSHGKHTGNMTAGTPSIGTCKRHVVSLPVVEREVGPDFAARYTEEA